MAKQGKPKVQRDSYILVTHQTATKRQRKTLRSYGFDVDGAMFDGTIFVGKITEAQANTLRAETWVLSVEKEVISTTQS